MGKLAGTIKTTDGGSIPLSITFVNEGGECKILKIEKSSAGLDNNSQYSTHSPAPTQTSQFQSTTQSPKLLTLSEAAQLTKQSIIALGDSINSRNFGSFHSGPSKLWQRQTTPEQLAESFQSFVDAKIDLTVIRPLEPPFDKEPFLDENGVLKLTGHFPTSPARLLFNLSFISEDQLWKLVRVNVTTKFSEE